MPHPISISRRALLGAPAVFAACRSRRSFSGYAFVANYDGPSVAAVDLTSFSVSKQIPLDQKPSWLLAAPDRPAVYAVCRSGPVFEIDARKLQVVRRVAMPGPVVGARISPQGTLWTLSREARLLSSLDGQRIKLPAPPDDFDIDSTGRLAAIASAQSNSMALCDLTGKTGIRQLTASGDPRMVRFRSDGESFLAANRATRILSIVDTATAKLVVNLSLPIEPVEICQKPDGGEIYLSGIGMDAVVVVYPYNTEIAETILAGRGPAAMAAVANPGYLLVTNPAPGDLTIIDMNTRKLVASMHVGQDPRAVVVTPDGQYALVLNQVSGNMAVILLGDLTQRRHKLDPPPLFTMISVGPTPVSAAIVRV